MVEEVKPVDPQVEMVSRLAAAVAELLSPRLMERVDALRAQIALDLAGVHQAAEAFRKWKTAKTTEDVGPLLPLACAVADILRPHFERRLTTLTTRVEKDIREQGQAYKDTLDSVRQAIVDMPTSKITLDVKAIREAAQAVLQQFQNAGLVKPVESVPETGA